MTTGCLFLETMGTDLGGGEDERFFHHRKGRTEAKVLSKYGVHRIHPQHVLKNITQLSPHWLVPVTEARSAPSDPRPQALKPLHRQDAHSIQKKSKTPYSRNVLGRVTRGKKGGEEECSLD